MSPDSRDQPPVERRVRSNLELLFSRAQDARVFWGFCLAQLGHFAILFALFFLVVVAPRTLLGEVPFDWKTLGTQYSFIVPVAGVVGTATLVGQIAVVGMFRPLRSLLVDSDSVDDWSDALRSALSRPFAVAAGGLLTLVALLVAIPIAEGLTLGTITAGIGLIVGREAMTETIGAWLGTWKGVTAGIVYGIAGYAVAVAAALAVLHVALPALYVVATDDDAGLLEAIGRGWRLARKQRRRLLVGVVAVYFILGIVNTVGVGAAVASALVLHCAAFVVVPVLLFIQPFGFYASWLLLTALFFTLEEDGDTGDSGFASPSAS